MPRQLSCRVMCKFATSLDNKMCKIVTWLDDYISSKSIMYMYFTSFWFWARNPVLKWITECNYDWSLRHRQLTHWGLNKMATILQMKIHMYFHERKCLYFASNSIYICSRWPKVSGRRLAVTQTQFWLSSLTHMRFASLSRHWVKRSHTWPGILLN